MMKLKGSITVSRASSSREPDFMHIRIIDEVAACTYRGRGKTLIAYKEFVLDKSGNILNRIRAVPEPWIVGVEKKVEIRRLITGGPRGSERFRYVAGFHAYASKPTESQRWGTTWGRVKLRGVRTKGTQKRRIVYVARFCKILELLS